ncbi:hypothetical protein [Leptolyngbya sp. NIES-2104]|uniref:hypothetical protein n=1 Tax=Leptolyngbya sp. NIES-2104 TaxID=1552121 RepID=UPI0006ECB5E9|nr:hypothetical protein [Leptolyngbya sp. NIES-2104]GAQ00102.1 hypothetical protein NIES2104_66670 [Leptolyngbya sp. NIES-2104]
MTGGKRKTLDDAFEKRFVFGETVPEAAKPESETPTVPPKELTQAKSSEKASPWADLEAPEREATIRLNVDIPVALNDRLAEKARKLRKPKTELVRRLLEWALDESNE